MCQTRVLENLSWNGMMRNMTSIRTLKKCPKPQLGLQWFPTQRQGSLLCFFRCHPCLNSVVEPPVVNALLLVLPPALV